MAFLVHAAHLPEQAPAHSGGRHRDREREPEQEDDHVAPHPAEGVADTGRGVLEVGVLAPEVVAGDVGVAVRAAVVDHFLVQQEHELTPELFGFVREVPVGVDVGPRQRHRDVLRGDRRRDEGETTRNGALAFKAAPELRVHGVEHAVGELLACLEEVAVIVDGERFDRLHPVFGERVVHHLLPALDRFLAGAPERIGAFPIEAGRKLGRRWSGGEGARHLRPDSWPEDRRGDPDAHESDERRPGTRTERGHAQREKDEDRQVHEIQGCQPRRAQAGVRQPLDALRAHQESGSEQYAEDQQARQAEGGDGLPEQERDRAQAGGQELAQRPGLAFGGDGAIEKDEDQQGTEDLDHPCRVQRGDPLDFDGVLDGPQCGRIAVVRLQPDGVPHVVGQAWIEDGQIEGGLEGVAREVGRRMGIPGSLAVPDLTIHRDRGSAFPFHRGNGAPPGNGGGQAEQRHDGEHGDHPAVPPVLPELLQGDGADHAEPPAPDTPRSWAR